jgi:hypothetical protein
MPFCENCGSPITGNVCQRCGWNAAQVPSQVTQQPQQYQQPQNLGPKRRSKAPIVIGAIIVIAIIILALMFFLVLNPEDEEIKEMTMEEFMDDYEDTDDDGDIDNLKSFNDGDKVRITDEVGDIHYDDDTDMTLILCESTEDMELSLPIVLDGDQRDRYDIGDPISVIWYIKRYDINGLSIEIPKEYYSYIQKIEDLEETPTSPTGALSFTETSVGNFTGGIISLSDEVKLSEASISIIDVSDGSAASQGPPLQSGVPFSTSGGMTLTFSDTNGNRKMDAGDVWTISGAENGDQVRWIYETGFVIATYTL